MNWVGLIFSSLSKLLEKAEEAFTIWKIKQAGRKEERLKSITEELIKAEKARKIREETNNLSPNELERRLRK